MDSKIVAWIMHVCILVDSKMNVNAWIRMHECECMDNAWLYFLWVTRWIMLHGDFLVGNKMDVNVMWLSCG